MKHLLFRAQSFNSLRRVHRQTAHFLKETPTLKTRMERCLLAWHSLHHVAPGELISFEPLRYRVPMLMARTEVEDSFWLADIGFYRQAVAALRTALELAVLAMHFAQEGVTWGTFQEWFGGTYHHRPFKRGILEPLFRNARFRRFEQTDMLLTDIEKCYDDLCAYSHSRGAPHSVLGLQLNTQIRKHILLAQALKEYSAFLRSVTRCCVTLGFMMFPVAMQNLPLLDKFPTDRPRVEHFPYGFLLAEERQNVLSVLSRRAIKALQVLSDADPGVQWMAQQIRSLPDIATPEGEAEWDLDLHYDRLAEWFAECERRSLAAK
jgi:hypothetical protein